MKSHEINATTEVESDKLDYKTRVYEDIPEAHRVLFEDIYKKVGVHLQVQVENEVNKLAEGAKAILQGLAPITTNTRRESVRASVSKVMDIRIAATETTRETAAGKDKIKEQDELLKERVKQLHGTRARARGKTTYQTRG